MTLVALLSAQEMAPGGRPVAVSDDSVAAPIQAASEYRALLPIAGQTLLERQARAALRHGASRILVSVAELPPELLAAIDAMRADGVDIQAVRSVAEVMAQVRPDHRLLMIGDGFHVPDAHFQAIAATAPGEATLLVTPDTNITATYERLDASTRWAGLALAPAHLLADILEIGPDWEPMLALMRHAVQMGARWLPVESTLIERGDIALATSPRVADALARRIVDATDATGVGVTQHWIFAPLARMGAQRLLDDPRAGLIMRVGSMLLLAVALVSVLLLHPLATVIAGLLACALDAGARFHAAFRPLRDMSARLALGYDMVALSVVGTAGAAASRGQGPLLLWIAVAATSILLLIMARSMRFVADDRGVRRAILPDFGEWIIIVGVALIAGNWQFGVMAAPVLFAAQIVLWQLAHRGPRPPV